MTKGKIDITKLRPLLFDMASMKYWSLRPAVGNIGMSENRSKENELKALVIEKSVPLVLLRIKEKP